MLVVAYFKMRMGGGCVASPKIWVIVTHMLLNYEEFMKV